MLKKGEFFINGTDVYEYSARLQSYTVGGTKITKSYTSPTVPFLPVVYDTSFGTRKLTVVVTFVPKRHISGRRAMSDSAFARSEFEAAIIGSQVDFKMPDGLSFFANLLSISDSTPDLTGRLDVTYTFDAVMHADKAVHTAGFKEKEGERLQYKFTAVGTARTPAVISIAVAEQIEPATFIMSITHSDGTAQSYSFGAAVTDNLRSITFDGIEKSVTAVETNGKTSNYFAKTEFTEFPYFTAGSNEITVNGYGKTGAALQIAYYPIYI